MLLDRSESEFALFRAEKVFEFFFLHAALDQTADARSVTTIKKFGCRRRRAVSFCLAERRPALDLLVPLAWQAHRDRVRLGP